MKLLVLPGFLALAVLTGASGSGTVKDTVAELFTFRGELARERAAVADLRHGRGAAAPAWLAKYADAICSHDADYIQRYTDPSLDVQLQDIGAQFETMHTHGQDCTGVRYLGSVNDRQFIFVLRQGKRDVSYVFTVTPDGQSVASVE